MEKDNDTDVWSPQDQRLRRSLSLQTDSRRRGEHKHKYESAPAPPSTPFTPPPMRRTTSAGHLHRVERLTTFTKLGALLFRSGSGEDAESKDGALSRTSTHASLEDLEAKDPEYKSTKAYFVKHDVKTLVRELKTSVEHGLSAEQVENGLERHGRNVLEKKKSDPIWLIFLKQFYDPLVFMLIAAAIVAGATSNLVLALAILAILLANGILGTQQNYAAEKSVEALSAHSEKNVTVRRSGETRVVPASSVVPGDILILKDGDIVAADGIILHSNKLEIDEKMLTGENVPVKKTRDEPERVASDEIGAFFQALSRSRYVNGGTIVAGGSGIVAVVKTGMQSAQGRIAASLNAAEAGESPLKEALERLGIKLGVASFIASLGIFVAGLALGRGLLEMTLIAVSVVVAAVPESLPVIITSGLTYGTRRMNKVYQVEVRNLSSVETLGSTSVICTDKTGTLTTGEMTAVNLEVVEQEVVEQKVSDRKEVHQPHQPLSSYIFSGGAWDYTEGTVEDAKGAFPASLDREDTETVDFLYLCLATMAACNTASTFYSPEDGKWHGEGSFTERALYAAARKAGVMREEDFEVLAINDFKTDRKRMSVVVRFKFKNTEKVYVLVKGAPNQMLDQCVGADEQSVMEANDRLAQQARRVLMLAYKTYDHVPESTEIEEVETNLTCLGLIGCVDPPRKAVPPAIVDARNAGVRTVMITGDYLKTAQAVAVEIGLVQPDIDDVKAVCIDCAEFRTASYKDKVRMALSVKVCARAIPQDKQELVRILKKLGFVVAMTGDGVNDAPALKESHVGVAMGQAGTDVAIAASDMVLVNDDFASIVGAIKEGRRIYRNLALAVYHLLSTNVAEVFLVLIAILAGMLSPLLPSQILWLNLTTDASPASALVFEKDDPDDMKRRPRHKDAGIVTKMMYYGITFNTLVLLAITLFTFMWGQYRETGDWTGGDAVHDNEDLVKLARTMTMYVIVFAELLRGHNCRSLRKSLWSLGFFGNRGAWIATFLSGAGTLLFGLVPAMQPVFDMVDLDATEWMGVIGLSLIAPVADEIWKSVASGMNIAPAPVFVAPKTLKDLDPETLKFIDDQDTQDHVGDSVSEQRLEIHVDRTRHFPPSKLRTSDADRHLSLPEHTGDGHSASITPPSTVELLERSQDDGSV